MKAYQLKIQIKNSKPPIWRRVVIPAGLSFAQLSIILNTVMGWCGYHLYSFEFYHLGIHIEDKDDEFDDMGFGEYVTYDAAETMIDPYLDSEEWFSYVYDFGDWWDHRVTVEKILDDYDKNYAQVIKFKGETPYEDCGGIYGYYDLLETLEDPDDPEHETMKAWTEDHFTMEYDVEEVNDELEHGLYLTNRKTKPVSQSELYRRYQEEGKPFNRIQGIWEIKEPEKRSLPAPRASILEDSFPEGMTDEEKKQLILKEIMDNISPELAKIIEAKHAHVDSHGEILGDYTKEDLVDIARINNLKGFTKYNKKDLIDFLCKELTKKEVMERYFKFMEQKALKIFEEDDLKIIIEKGDAAYDELLDGGYVGIQELLFEDTVVIPETVKQAYKEHFSGNWYEKAADDRRMLCYLNGLARLYGVCPLEKFTEIYRLHLDIDLEKSALLAICKEIPENKKAFVIKGNKLVLRRINESNVIKNLEVGQGDKSYYLPTIKEVEMLGKQGYLPFDKHMRALESYLLPLMDNEKEAVRMVCAEIQYIIRIGGRMQDVMDLLEDVLMDFEDWDDLDVLDEEDDMNEAIMNETFVQLMQNVWNHTRMVANRGHYPLEMYQEQQAKADVPDNVIPFPGNRHVH